MTKITSYTLLKCPYCGQIHRKAVFSSINLQVTSEESFKNIKDLRQCVSCLKTFSLGDMIDLGQHKLPLSLGFLDLMEMTTDKRPLLRKLLYLIQGKPPTPIVINETRPDWLEYPVIS